MSCCQQKKIFMIHDIIESNGKTIKENNLEKRHNISIGALVELILQNDDEYDSKGVRLYVKRHTRDCDGTPLYSLGLNSYHETNQYHGYPEESLRKIIL